MPFATMQDIIDALPGQNVGFQKAFTTAGGGAGVWWSAWGGTTPSSGLAGAVVSDADTGAIPFANANAGNHLHIGRAQVGAGSTTTGVVSGVLSLYDRLWQNSGIDRTSTSAQTINSVALNRPDNTGFDVEAWHREQNRNGNLRRIIYGWKDRTLLVTGGRRGRPLDSDLARERDVRHGWHHRTRASSASDDVADQYRIRHQTRHRRTHRVRIATGLRRCLPRMRCSVVGIDVDHIAVWHTVAD
jgi:hypothetical protein